MATYKKKSNKLRKSRVSSESSSTKKVFDTLDTSANKSELIISKYQNYLVYGITIPVSYTHLRAHETSQDLVCRLLLEKKK